MCNKQTIFCETGGNWVLNRKLVYSFFLTREYAHAHERVIAIVGFSLGRSVGWSVGWLVRLLTFGHAQ